MTTDPQDELFDVLTADGSPAGLVKRRAAVHADGDWHRTFHLWLVWLGEDREARVLVQQRSAGKDTWPGRLDVAVGGHFRAGEGLAEVIREVEEELGLRPRLDELRFAFRRRVEHVTEDFVDRELQEVYVWPLASLPALRPDVAELAAVVQVSVADLERLWQAGAAVPGLRAEVAASGLSPWGATRLTQAGFVPVRDDYWVRGARRARALLAERDTG